MFYRFFSNLMIYNLLQHSGIMCMTVLWNPYTPHDCYTSVFLAYFRIQRKSSNHFYCPQGVIAYRLSIQKC